MRGGGPGETDGQLLPLLLCTAALQRGKKEKKKYGNICEGEEGKKVGLLSFSPFFSHPVQYRTFYVTAIKRTETSEPPTGDDSDLWHAEESERKKDGAGASEELVRSPASEPSDR